MVCCAIVFNKSVCGFLFLVCATATHAHPAAFHYSSFRATSHGVTHTHAPQNGSIIKASYVAENIVADQQAENDTRNCRRDHRDVLHGGLCIRDDFVQSRHTRVGCCVRMAVERTGEVRE